MHRTTYAQEAPRRSDQPVAHPADVLLEQHSAKLGERLAGWLVKRPHDRLAFGDVEREDACTFAVRGFKAFGEPRVVDQARESRTSGPGMGKPASSSGRWW